MRSLLKIILLLVMVFVGILLLSTAWSVENQEDALVKYQRALAFVNVCLIDGTGSPAKANQTVILTDGNFAAVGNKGEVVIPLGMEVIDLEGKTMIPGIVGLHNHLHIPGFPFVGDVASVLQLASGVTTIQTCGAASPDREIALAKRIEAGLQYGPDIINSGPYFTGPGGSPAMVHPRSEQHIRDTMRYWIDKGVSWFKVYRHTSPKDLPVILDEAHRHDCKVSGHFCSITFEEAINMGIDGIEHGLKSASDFRANKEPGICGGSYSYMDELDVGGAEVRRLQQLMIDSSVFLCSTISIVETRVPQRAFADERTIEAMSPYLRQQYRDRRARLDAEMNDSSELKRLKRVMAFDYQFHQMGGLLAAGADPGRHNLPGFGDQRNFELFIEAGFSIEEAMQVMSLNGASILGIDNIGSVEKGKRADFVILDGMLTEDPSVIKRVQYVFKGGIGYDSERLLETVRGKFGLD